MRRAQESGACSCQETGDRVEASPEVHDGFEWLDGGAGRALVCGALAPMAAHVFTTRQLAFRGETERADMQRLSAVLDVAPDDVVTVKQVHGRRMLTVRAGDRLESQREADAIISLDRSRAIAVRVADCVPILIGDRKSVV